MVPGQADRLYLAEPGSASAERILGEIGSRPATRRHHELAERAWRHAVDADPQAVQVGIGRHTPQ
jgi:uncharacterized protein (DUF1800 family)